MSRDNFCHLNRGEIGKIHLWRKFRLYTLFQRPCFFPNLQEEKLRKEAQEAIEKRLEGMFAVNHRVVDQSIVITELCGQDTATKPCKE